MSKMERHLGFLCIALALVTVAIGFGNAACPATEQIDSAIQQCFGDMSSDVYINFNMAYVTAFCSNDEYTNALACAENIYNECVAENNEVKDTLERFIEFERYAETFKYICGNIQVLEENDACIQNAFNLTDTAICIQAITNTYLEELAKLPSVGLASRLEVTCRFFEGIEMCATPQYMICGPEVMEMLNRTLSLFGPNSCQPNDSHTLVTLRWCQEGMLWVKKCLTDNGFNWGHWNVDKTTVTAICLDQAYKDALTCIETNYNVCVEMYPETRLILDQIIIMDKYADTFEYICDNIQALVDNEKCLETASRSQIDAACEQTLMEAFEAEIGVLWFNRTDLVHEIPFFCKYAYGSVPCKLLAYDTCGSEVVSIIMNIYELHVPQGCRELGSEERDPSVSECREPIPRIVKCFNTIGITSTESIDKDVVSVLCHLEMYSGALMCIETLYNKCVDLFPETQSRLDKIIIMDKYTETFEYICGNIQAIVDNEMCIDVASRVVPNSDCFESGYELLQADLTASGFTVDDVDEAFPYFCKYWYSGVECRRQAYEMCGKEVRQIVMTVDKLLLPQGCSELQPDPKPTVSGSKVATSNEMMILGMLGAMLSIIQLLYVL